MVKDTRTKILLSLILIGDINFSPVVFDEKIEKVFDLSFNQKTKSIINSLIKDGFIIQQNESQSYSLTERGFLDFCLEFPFFRFLKYSWDRRWRIISYEIPESKREIRDRLRRQMQGWGLGPWHRSFWVTPHPVIESLRWLIGGKEEEKYFQAFEADHVFGSREVLVEKVWEKTKLDGEYRQLFRKWHEVLSSQEDKVSKFKKIVDTYVDLLKIDPGLPKELIGESWIGFEGWGIFREIRNILFV
jgi:phenylacetic acid degradation operon negative regulatory protein